MLIGMNSLAAYLQLQAVWVLIKLKVSSAAVRYSALSITGKQKREKDED